MSKAFGISDVPDLTIEQIIEVDRAMIEDYRIEVSTLVGELYLADISVPPGLYRRPPLDLPAEPIFAGDEILRIG